MLDTLRFLKDFVSAHSPEFVIFIGGCLGAGMADHNKEITLSRKQKALRMFFGGVTAIFSTQLVIELLSSFTSIELSSTASAGLGFYIGHIGLQGITKLMVTHISKNKEEKEKK